MNVKLIGIVGGTGAGKSTLASSFMDKYPDKIGVVQLDDYFKPKDQAPTPNGYSNFEHPDSLFIDKLAKDLSTILEGRSVTINTKNEKLNPDFEKTKKRIPTTIQPMPIMLVEGYLVLFDERVRNLLNTSIWLEVEHDTRWERRVHFKFPEYEEKVLKPMHKKFAEPTKQYADLVIDVGKLSKEEVFQKAEEFLKPFL